MSPLFGLPNKPLIVRKKIERGLAIPFLALAPMERKRYRKRKIASDGRESIKEADAAAEEEVRIEFSSVFQCLGHRSPQKKRTRKIVKPYMPPSGSSIRSYGDIGLQRDFVPLLKHPDALL
ncbi:hypothetical protein SDC9_185600 [bioreactor metagenome]|uniref:Uncharacterized protein n=1 Tax=bioreactor metagenome TaxID=1076179 RepID=A0A645HGJ5_9ZZZZ